MPLRMWAEGMCCWQWVMIRSIGTRIRLSVSSCHVNVWKNPEQLIQQSGSSLHPALWVKGSCSRGGCSHGESAFPDTLWMTDVEAEQPLWSQAFFHPLAVGQYCWEWWWKEGHEDILHFEAFSYGMLKWIPRIIQMFQVTPRECHLSFMLAPV